jgi:hypothetical protein
MTINISGKTKKEIEDGTKKYFCFSKDSNVIKQNSVDWFNHSVFTLLIKFDAGNCYSLSYYNAKEYLEDDIFFIFIGALTRKDVIRNGETRSIIYLQTKEQLKRVKEKIRKDKIQTGQLSFQL